MKNTFNYQISPVEGKLKVQIDTGMRLDRGNVKINQTTETRGEAVAKVRQFLRDNPQLRLEA